MKTVSVLDVMFVDPFTVRPMQSVAEAAMLMRDIDCGILPIAEDGAPIGLITDRDITVRVTAEGRDPKKTLIKHVMTQAVHTCSEATSLEDAAAMMRRHNVSRLLVTRGGRVRGVVTLKHLLMNAGDMWTTGKVIQMLRDEPEMIVPARRDDLGLSLWS